MTSTIVLNADFKDGTPVAVCQATSATDKFDALEQVTDMWRAVTAQRRRQGKTTKTIAPPNWWLNASAEELADVMDWLDSPAVLVPQAVGKRTNFLSATKRHTQQLKTAIGFA